MLAVVILPTGRERSPWHVILPEVEREPVAVILELRNKA
jgi:hypothetical protein